ncbi:hypothetical protein [Massilia sp. TS11]|uniref:hypothetical protein n=1 Tax=Massilia sp. TS11 TaxID=2908003 RepID=UPI001EDC5D98|nr:hypothetical protein [Massilia sp. TS11]MCG2585982.1 hypothetical protein [Massilia sp. TS11]
MTNEKDYKEWGAYGASKKDGRKNAEQSESGEGALTFRYTMAYDENGMPYLRSEVDDTEESLDRGHARVAKERDRIMQSRVNVHEGQLDGKRIEKESIHVVINRINDDALNVVIRRALGVVGRDASSSVVFSELVRLASLENRPRPFLRPAEDDGIPYQHNNGDECFFTRRALRGRLKTLRRKE